MIDVYIQRGLRTPIGLAGKQFARVRPELLGAQLINALVKADKLAIDEVICGNAVGTGGNISRLMTLYSDLGETVPATTVDMQCASAGAALTMGYSKIKAGLATRLLAGGIESSSLQPQRIYAAADSRSGAYEVAQFSPDTSSQLAMIAGAERVAQTYQMTPSQLNQWTLTSHQKAHTARQKHWLADIILEMPGISDQGIRPRLSEKVLSKVPPILDKAGLISAANTCLTHDAAAFLVLSSQKSAYQILDLVEVAGNPKTSPQMVVEASQVLLARNGLAMTDMDAIEWNEAFAVIDLLFEHYFSEALDRYNIFGGALAYGHPFGASAAIIILHLMQALALKQGRYGLAAIPAAGGQAFALLLEYHKDYSHAI